MVRVFKPCGRQAPKIDARVIRVSAPCRDRVPPLILRLVTRCRRLRSAGTMKRGHPLPRLREFQPACPGHGRDNGKTVTIGIAMR